MPIAMVVELGTFFWGHFFGDMDKGEAFGCLWIPTMDHS